MSYSRPSLMIIVPGTQFHIYLLCLKCLNSVLNVKVVVATFNQEKALVGAFTVITNIKMDLCFKL